ncbi:hypothetical protein [Thalassotalea sp. PS06]|uniref:hypothetical protein n=1 Tax=Thalassotalea sp. PS06 TaxID=2594005 RepID=UPI001162A2F0|nr:hypothetical protein [Thalassotalea sp. PS06]QDP01601.1 hypothetical protein FNC98_09800 [Thalassotalea sp. PS06]
MGENKSFRKYLDNFAEVEVTSLKSFPTHLQFSHVVVLPAYKERADFFHRFCALAEQTSSSLLISIINQPDTDTKIKPQQALFSELESAAEMLWQCDNLTLFMLDAGGYVLVVDRFTTPIPAKQGVGLARKIGADLACQLMAAGQIKSPWICSTDADAHLPDNYFSALPQSRKGISALVFDFYHQSAESDANVAEDAASRLYEKSMRYYVAGLTYAGSPYNFFTIGSILAFSGDDYVKARGFPKRSAGEDFYLLNKLAKLGKIKNEQSVQIKIDARVSDRVPFGTGPAVQKIIELSAQKQDYQYYRPQVFVELKQVLEALAGSEGDLTALTVAIENLSTECRSALNDIGFISFIEKQQLQSVSMEQSRKQLLVWFDAFKTLKFIHAVRDHGLTDIPLQQALDNPYFQTP